jgi:hypothetical protein
MAAGMEVLSITNPATASNSESFAINSNYLALQKSLKVPNSYF